MVLRAMNWDLRVGEIFEARLQQRGRREEVLDWI